jgi:hypothetical protein
VEEFSKDKSQITHFNSVQLNIVTFVDVRGANASNKVYGNVHMMDNSTNSNGQGTQYLQTYCKPGQTLNWIIYAIDAERRPDGTWPPSVRINNLVFLEGDGKEVSGTRICSELKIFGGPDKMRSELTRVYYYWAGTVVETLPPGVYRYRLVLELETEKPGKKRYLNLDTPSLNIVPI